MASFQIKGVNYQSRPIDGVKQWHLMRRLLPAFTALASVSVRMREAQTVGDEDSRHPLERIATSAAPVTLQLSRMSDDDVEYILNCCMDVTERQTDVGIGWTPVRAPNGAVQNQNDMLFAVRAQIAWHVIGETFTDVFEGFEIDLQNLTDSVKAVH